MLPRKLLSLLLALSLLPVGLPAQQAQPPHAVITAAPPESPEHFAARRLALQEMLQRLTTTGRIMQVVAHPDDEDGSMLTLESRVKGNTAELFTFTRGEGGQNAQGAVFFDELGILRTLELLAADKEYGAEERFSHVADFGFSKSAEETYAKWGDEDVPLADLVRAIREFQPDVLVARFSGTPRDGHGHHQASAQMTIKAFTDAASPKRFPSQNPHRLSRSDLTQPWQPSKLYTGLAGDQATLVPDEIQPSPLLEGKTPQEVAIAGLRHQESQGAGNWKGPIPKIYSSYKLVETANGVPKPDHETDFFQGIDTSLPGLVDRFPKDAATIPNLRPLLERLTALIAQAKLASESSPEGAVKPLAEACEALMSSHYLDHLRPDAEKRLASASDPIRSRLEDKQLQLRDALILAAGLDVTFAPSKPLITSPFVIAGETVPMTLTITNYGSARVHLDGEDYHGLIAEDIFGSLGEWMGHPAASLPDWIESRQSAQVTVMSYTIQNEIDRALFERKSPVRDFVYQVPQDDNYDQTALPRPFLSVLLPFQIDSAKFLQRTDAHIGDSAVFVAPPFSISAAPIAVLRRLNQAHETSVQVAVKNNSDHAASGTVALNLPKGWSSEPKQSPLSIAPGATSDTAFVVHWPENAQPIQSTLKAGFTSAGKTYSENYHLVCRADLPDSFPYYAPAQTTISLINADIPEKHNIGYIMGAGDTLPDDLASLGFTVHLLTDEDLASSDLSVYDTIVTGIRSYATRPALRDHNPRLLDYAKSGGTLVVQYEQDFDGFNRGHFTPYPAVMGKDRVSQEEQPVTMLDPDAQIFRYPNRITSADFDGWVQERGLYFMKEWSPEYTPLLSMHDEGELPLEGGLLEAHYGKGIYIYSGLALYRQLPNGVSGATRLFINLLGAGHNPADQPVTSASR